MSKIALFILVAFTLIALPSCRKVYDFIHDHPDAHDTLCRIQSISSVGPYGPLAKYIISYNAKGDPVTMIDSLRGFSGTLDVYFRYDRLNRLSDLMSVYPGNFGAVAWHKYAYPRPGFITDTAMFYDTGDIRGPSPIAKNTYSYRITGFSQDAHGRIIKTWSIPNDPPNTPELQSVISYDANGNLPLPSPDLSYDDKVNVYRTNKVWQFLYNDYSRNNVVKIDYYFFTNYNNFGLPLNLRNLQSYNIYLFGFYNTSSEADIVYTCSMPRGPIDY